MNQTNRRGEEPHGAAKWLILLGLGVLLCAAVAIVMTVLPVPAALDGESAMLIPLAAGGLTALGLILLAIGLLVNRVQRRSRV